MTEIVKVFRRRTLRCSMVVEVRLNLECASGLVLDRKAGLYHSIPLVSAASLAVRIPSRALTCRRAHSYPPQNRFSRYRGPSYELGAVLRSGRELPQLCLSIFLTSESLRV